MSSNSEQIHRDASEASPLLNGSHAVYPAYPASGILRSWASRLYREARAAIRLQNANALLILVPIGLAGGFLRWNALAVLAINIIAIVPLCTFVSSSSEHLAGFFGELVGGLVGATFGNTVELIVGILALGHGEIHFAQSVMLGSILSDILFVLGFCLIAASYNKKNLPKFNRVVTDALSSLMTITAVALVLPTALYSTFTKVHEIGDKIMTFSRATASVLLATYAFYLYFQLGSHRHIFLEAEREANLDGEARTADNNGDEGDAGTQSAPWGVFRAVTILLVSSLAVAACARCALDSANEASALTGMPKPFIAAILVPIASNATECSTVFVAARKQHINYAVGVIVSSILQIALFVLPVLVIIGWCSGQPMMLYFIFSEALLLFFAVIVVNCLLQDGRYTYIHGAMLVALYIIFAMTLYLGEAGE